MPNKLINILGFMSFVLICHYLSYSKPTHKYPVTLNISRSPSATDVSEQMLSQDTALFRAAVTTSASSHRELVSLDGACVPLDADSMCNCLATVLSYIPANFTDFREAEDCCVVANDETCGQEGLGGGLIHTGKEDWANKVDILIEETGLGIGEIEVVSIIFDSSLLKQKKNNNLIILLGIMVIFYSLVDYCTFST